MELRADVFERFNELLNTGNDEVLKKLRKYMLHLKKTVADAEKDASRETAEDLRPYTMEELNARIDEAEAEIEAGEVLTSAEANEEVRKVLPWLM